MGFLQGYLGWPLGQQDAGLDDPLALSGSQALLAFLIAKLLPYCGYDVPVTGVWKNLVAPHWE